MDTLSCWACSGYNSQVQKNAANMQGYSFNHITSSGSVKRLWEAETDLGESLGHVVNMRVNTAELSLALR